MDNAVWLTCSNLSERRCFRCSINRASSRCALLLAGERLLRISPTRDKEPQTMVEKNGSDGIETYLRMAVNGGVSRIGGPLGRLRHFAGKRKEPLDSAIATGAQSALPNPWDKNTKSKHPTSNHERFMALGRFDGASGTYIQGIDIGGGHPGKAWD